MAPECKTKGYCAKGSHHLAPCTISEISKKKCGQCKRRRTAEGHDGCLGKIEGAMNACCGHRGHGEGPYIQYWDGRTLRDEDAISEFTRLGVGPKNE